MCLMVDNRIGFGRKHCTATFKQIEKKEKGIACHHVAMQSLFLQCFLLFLYAFFVYVLCFLLQITAYNRCKGNRSIPQNRMSQALCTYRRNRSKRTKCRP